MGVNSLSWKRIRALNRRLDERFVHVYTLSHYEFWIWWAIRHDGSAAKVDTRTWWSYPRDLVWESTTYHLLTTREPRDEEQAAWLQVLDERQAEIERTADHHLNGNPNRGSL